MSLSYYLPQWTLLNAFLKLIKWIHRSMIIRRANPLIMDYQPFVKQNQSSAKSTSFNWTWFIGLLGDVYPGDGDYEQDCGERIILYFKLDGAIILLEISPRNVHRISLQWSQFWLLFLLSWRSSFIIFHCKPFWSYWNQYTDLWCSE